MQKKTNKINKEWHLAHRMPKNPTLEQRVQWHMEHAKHCCCRPVPAGLQQQINNYKAKM